jgi:protease-4
MSVERAGDLAEGRVWIGSDALELGLVDELGGLDPAIASAAGKVGLSDGEYGIKYVEKPLAFHERLLLEFAIRMTTRLAALSDNFGVGARSLLVKLLGHVETEIGWLAKLNDPRGLYYHCFCQLP